MNINEIWNEIENNKIVNWHNHSYRIVKQKANEESEYQKKHFTYKNGYVLVILHDNGFQCILHESEMKYLYR